MKNSDRRALAAWLWAPEAHQDKIHRIAVDECNRYRGIAYATVVLDHERKHVIWIAQGRDAGALGGTFTALGFMHCALVAAATVERSHAYGDEIVKHGPQVKLVHDYIHLAAICGRKVVERARVDATNRLAETAGPGPIRNARRVVKWARGLLLRNRSTLTTSADRVRLRDPLIWSRRGSRIKTLVERSTRSAVQVKLASRLVAHVLMRL